MKPKTFLARLADCRDTREISNLASYAHEKQIAAIRAGYESKDWHDCWKAAHASWKSILTQGR